MSRRWQTCIWCSTSIAGPVRTGGDLCVRQRQTMSHWVKTLLLFALLIALTGLAAGALLISHIRVESDVTSGISSERPDQLKVRNLFVQPETVKLSRRLGRGFNASSRATFVLAGTITTSDGQQSVTIVRSQSDTGENVRIVLPNRIFNWSDQEGVTVGSGDAPSQVERIFVERVVLDSADQFILAQLRGASYQVVTRNARPVEAGASDSYSGPIWDLVRVTYSERDAQTRLLSSSRLYYINSTTGLIDKIVYDVNDHRVEVLLCDWNTVSGESVPSRIVWKSQTETVMQFTLNTFTP